jgi:hypothetical protein
MPDGLTTTAMDDLGFPGLREDRRQRPSDLDGVRRGVWIAVLLAHVAGGVLIDRLMHRDLAVPPAPAQESSFEVRFLDPAPVSEPATAALPVEPTAQRPMPQRRNTVEPDAGVAVQFLPRDPEPATLDTRRLFDPNGRVQLPDGMVTREAVPQRSPMDPPRRLIPDQRTRFDAAWEPDGESLGQELVRKVPPLGLLLQGVNPGPNCPPNSTDPRCEAIAQEQRARIPPTPQSARQPW